MDWAYIKLTQSPQNLLSINSNSKLDFFFCKLSNSPVNFSGDQVEKKK
ncbi:hypothetical protein RDI58_027523 [Solanum bulbocastanum]|uniref:Uncharacterized protein n=1 Tax=Solanum bulbocastanum TaxID=147425 RepID=A0AAN8T0X3_SOLBU